MSIPTEYQVICEKLIEATNENRVNWIDQRGSVIVALKDFTVEIWSSTDETDREFVAMGLRDNVDRILFDTWYVKSGDADFDKMHTLLNTAHRKARNVEQKLQNLKKLLETNAPIGAATSEILTIESAQYGAGERTIDVSDLLRKKIQNGRIEMLPVINAVFGSDPAPGTVKILKVAYFHLGEHRTAVFTENTLLSLP